MVDRITTMSAPTNNIQIINGPDGKPAFVVIPYEEYVSQHGGEDLIVVVN